MGEFKGNPSKYTESELKDRGIGRILQADGDPGDREKYKVKKKTYENEGVWRAFAVLRNSFKPILLDVSGIRSGFVDPYLCSKCAQIMIDTFLLRRCRGETVQVPREVVPVNAAPDEKMVELLDAGDFGDMKQVSANTEIRWIFNNMKMAADPKTAPSPGAYALLKELQGNTEQRRDFYKTIYPKLLTKEDAEKDGKLHDDGKETIQLLERLLEAVESEG